MWNVGCYANGMMGHTANIDRIGREGIIFTDHYGQASCTAGRAAFIMGQVPVRTGMTTIGIPGSPRGIQKETPRSRKCSSRRATPPASSARTISATATSSCRPCTGSTSGSATSTTSMPRRSRRNSTTPARRTRITPRSTARVASSMPGRRTRTMRPRIRCSAVSASRRLRTPVPSRGSGWRRSTPRCSAIPSTGSTEREGRQALVLLVQHDRHSHLVAPPEEIRPDGGRRGPGRGGCGPRQDAGA